MEPLHWIFDVAFGPVIAVGVAIVIAAIAGIALIVLGIVLAVRSRKNKRK